MDKRKATRPVVKTNPEVRLQEENPNIGSKSWVTKRRMPNRPVFQSQPRKSVFNEKESNQSSKSATEHSDENFYDTPEVPSHEGLPQEDPFGYEGGASDMIPTGRFSSVIVSPPRSNVPEYVPVTDISSESEDIMPDLEELQMLRRQLTEQKSIEQNLKKKRELEVRKVIEEREELLRSIKALKEQNMRTAAPWQPTVLNNIDDLREEQQRLLQGNATQDPVVRQLHDYVPAHSTTLAGSSLSDVGKGKQKSSGIHIQEPANDMRDQRAISAFDIEMEEKRKEQQELERELERIETGTKIAETKKRIAFLKSFSNTPAGGVDEAAGPSVPVSSGANKNVTFNCPSSSFDKGNPNVKNEGQLRNGNISSSGGTAFGASQRRPIQLEGYRQLYFEGIPGFPNPISQELRNMLSKFSANNAVSCEDHLRSFLDLINDYEVQHEDVVMKLFVQSLTEDAREWFKRLPHESITSWTELEKCFREQYGEKPNTSYVLNDFNNIKKLPNESISEFNTRFQKGMYKLLQVINVGENVCLTTYFGAFDGKIAYQLRDKDPKTLKDAFRIAVNIENNLRISGKLSSKRDDPKLFGGKGIRKDDSKNVGGKKQEEDKIDQVLKAIKGLTPPAGKNNSNEYNRSQSQGNYKQQYRLQEFPYNTQWKDGRPILPNNNNNKNVTEKVTPDPLQRNTVNIADDPQWCIVCQSPHSPDYCTIALSLADSQADDQEQPDHEQGKDSGCNTLDFNSDGSRNLLTSTDDVYLKKPTREEIAAITAHMVAQVQTRNMAAKNDGGGSDQKNKTVSKTWEAKKVKLHGPSVAHNGNCQSGKEKVLAAADDKIKKHEADPSSKHKEVKGMSADLLSAPVDMLQVLSQITVKVPLSELLRIPEHKEKTLSWVGCIKDGMNPDSDLEIALEDKEKTMEVKGVVSQIPPMYLDESINQCEQDIDPFFLSVIINGHVLKNCMIDSGASNTVMPLEVMKALGLMVDTTEGRCYAMDQRDVTVIGTINAMPYRLSAHPKKLMTMSVLVVDIPARYGMLLSRKWSASMGGSMQCDLSYATFLIDNKLIKIERESRSTYTIEKNMDNEITCFVDTDINAFRAEAPLLEKDPVKVSVATELSSSSSKDDLWTMYFDGACCKEGSGAGILLISPSGETYKFSFTLGFFCTNNIAEYEALLLGLKLVQKYGIKNVLAIGDSELVVSQVRGIYVSKNKRLKQYRNAVWDLLEGLDAFGIAWKDRSNNKMADLLANIAIKPDDVTFAGISEVEVQTRPSVPNNVESWQVFNDDKDILNFLYSDAQFAGQEIDGAVFVENSNGQDTIFGQDIVQLKSNKIPKGLVVLETVFDNLDRSRAVELEKCSQDHEEINLGTENTPKKVYIGRKINPEIRKALIQLLTKYKHVFAWSYDDLKAYREDLFQHEIPLKEGAKPFRQKQRYVNPVLAPKMQDELRKMRNAGIIKPIRHSSWVSNLVPVRKKNGDIRLCVDFRNLNMSSLKDNYCLPNMEAMLQKVTGSELMSMMDGFSGYNQVVVKESEQFKTAFTTPWGTYTYCRMPFGLINAGATFQRAMDVAFADIIDDFLAVYQDDLTAYSKKEIDHCRHLEEIFIRALKFGISLNPKKCTFAVTEGKLLGHLVGRDGVRIDPERVEAIDKIQRPKNVKGVQSFFGQINFLRRFVTNFAEISRPIARMMKKGVEIKWDEEPCNSFVKIKQAIKDAPVLMTPDYSKPMHLFSFASFHTVAAVLLQKNKDGFQQPIAFFSKSLQAAELKYDINEKQAYALVKAIKAFRCYLMGATVIAYVPSAAIKDIFSQREVSGRWCRWINRIQEFNVDIQVTKLVRGQGLAKLMAETNLEANQINQLDVSSRDESCDMDDCGWYQGVIYYLRNLRTPPELTESQKRSLKLQAIKYIIIKGKLYWKSFDGILLKCIDNEHAEKVLNDMHSGECGGHFMARTTAHKILRAGFWWPTLFKDAHVLVRKCDACQRFTGRLKFSGNVPLITVEVHAPFQQWGIDFIGEIVNKSSGGHSWILVATDYFTKWVEAIPVRKSTSRVVTDFILNNIIIRFGCPEKIVTDNAMCFRSQEYMDFCDKYGIKRSTSSPYHPQGNGQAESSNKSLLKIIKRILGENKKSWDSKLPLALWADRVTVKQAIGQAPFDLVYGVHARLPQNNLQGMYNFIQKYDDDISDEMQMRMEDILQLDEIRRDASANNLKLQTKVKHLYDKRTVERRFQPGHMVLCWNARNEDKGKHAKFEPLWLGPFIVHDYNGENSYFLRELTGDIQELPVHGQFLKLYFS